MAKSRDQSGADLYQSKRVNEGHWTGDGVIIPALATTALMPVYNPDGTWSSQAEYAVAGDGLSGVPNAVALAKDIENKRANLRFFGNMFAEISILRNLKFKTTIGADMMNYRSKFFRPSNVPKGGTVAHFLQLIEKVILRTKKFLIG